MTNLSGVNLNSGAAVGRQGKGMDCPSTFPAYSVYKDSGIEWVDILPGHWRKVALKWVSRIFAGGTPDKTKTHYWENGSIPWLNSGAVNQVLISEPSALITTEAFNSSSARWIPSGSLVIALAGQGKTKGMVAQLAIRTTCNQSMAAIIPAGDVRPRYLFWWLTNNYQNIRNMSGGDLRDGLNLELISNIPVLMPSKAEQTQIARFLDHETARIDALIEEQQRLIELLMEKRQAVISHAVTKGLDPKVPMKDSGVEWLGEVPAHWIVSKFGYISSVVRGGSPRPAGDPELFNGDYSPWVTVAEITKDDEIYLDETETFLTKKGSDQCRVFSKGTLLLSNSGATLGVPKILMIDANANDGVVGFENISLDKEYSYLYLATLTEGLRDKAAGSGQPNLNTDIVKSIDVPIPPSNEVAEIIAAVKKLRAQFNFLSKEAAEGIRLLQERRSALISAAVTGKIDVRCWQPPARAQSPELEEEAV